MKATVWNCNMVVHQRKQMYLLLQFRELRLSPRTLLLPPPLQTTPQVQRHLWKRTWAENPNRKHWARRETGKQILYEQHKFSGGGNMWRSKIPKQQDSCSLATAGWSPKEGLPNWRRDSADQTAVAPSGQLSKVTHTRTQKGSSKKCPLKKTGNKNKIN